MYKYLWICRWKRTCKDMWVHTSPLICICLDVHVCTCACVSATRMSCMFVKEWLAGGRRRKTWRCYECQFPVCAGSGCGKRPLHAIPHNALIDGEYFCERCKYPACGKCGQKQQYIDSKRRFMDYICAGCLDAGMAPREKQKICQRCKQPKDHAAFDRKKGRNAYNVCRDCQHPDCSLCGKKMKNIWAPSPKEKNPVPVCAECQKQMAIKRKKR